MPSSVSIRTRRTSMLVTARSRSRGGAPVMTIGSVTTCVSTRVIFMARVCYTAAARAGRGKVPPPLSSVKGLGSPPLHGLVVTVGPAVLGRGLVYVAAGFSQRRERAIRGRRIAGQPMEHHREVAARAKADRARDGIDRHLPRGQKLAGTLDAPLHDEAVRRQPGALLEQPGEVILAHVRLGTEVGERQRPGKVVVDEFRHAPKSRPWQPVHRLVILPVHSASVSDGSPPASAASMLRMSQPSRSWTNSSFTSSPSCNSSSICASAARRRRPSPIVTVWCVRSIDRMVPIAWPR